LQGCTYLWQQLNLLLRKRQLLDRKCINWSVYITGNEVRLIPEMTTTAPACQTGNDDRSFVFPEKRRFLAQSDLRRPEEISSPVMKGNDGCWSRFGQKGKRRTGRWDSYFNRGPVIGSQCFLQCDARLWWGSQTPVTVVRDLSVHSSPKV
jgi:hypothetical protein